MNSYLSLKKSNCENCYKCIRNCPVKSISFSNKQAYIVEDECILCGNCFVACPQNAKEIRNDIDKVKEMIKSNKKVYASIAPSFIASYDRVNIKTMEKALKKLGFEKAEETSIGATIVKKAYEAMIEEKSQSVIISSCCHTVNTIIQKYYPEALKYVAPIMSPMQAHAQKVKKEYQDSLVVFIGPCISKKEEADLYPGMVDCVLTYEELSKWMDEENITFEYEEDDMDKFRARLFPTTGGIIRTMDLVEEDYSYISIDGVDNCIRAIEDIISGEISNCFIEMSACVGSCVCGPAVDKNHKAPITDVVMVNKYSSLRDYEVDMPSFDNLKKDMPYVSIKKEMPGSKVIEDILKKMGKTTPHDELNCGSCGYNTCREKAVAVYMGKAEISMCLPYLKEKAESFSDNIINNTPNGIIVLNEKLEVQQMNNACRRMFNVDKEMDEHSIKIEEIVSPDFYIEILSSDEMIKSRRVYVEKFNKYIDETLIYDKSYHIIISIMRDITEEEEQKASKEKIRNKTVAITDQIIEKQMRIVQEIASLLGETAAETKVAITNLKRTLNDE